RGERKGYRHTVEMPTFCRPDHTARGMGTLLSKKLIEVLQSAGSFLQYVSNPKGRRLKNSHGNRLHVG
ncbi:hypothetical protein GQ43DRAFT_376282, partial [Delitschia confertaspora ATCC 74209]